MAKQVEWAGSTKCDWCHTECKEELIDGRTTWGCWAVMCPTCFSRLGVGIGPGLGQRYRRPPLDLTGRLVKVEG